MKRFLLCITFLSVLIMSGCGSKEDDGVVHVEIEQLSELTPAVSMEQNVVSDTNTESNDDEITDVEGAAKEETSAEEQNDATQTAEIVEDAPNRIRVATVGGTGKEILEVAKEELAALGYELSVIECDNYSQPNSLLVAGNADACLCENQALLDSYNLINATNLSIVERAYTEPFGIFPGKSNDLNHCKKDSVIAVINGEVTTARALYLLQQKGLIELKPGSSYQACMEDVVSNPYNIKIETVDFDAAFPDMTKYDYIICDYNHALLNGISPDEALGYENRNSELTDFFAVCLVASSDKCDSEKLGQLSKALNSDKVEKYIKDSFYGAVVDYR